MIAGSHEPFGHGLSRGQLTRLVIIGVIFWFAAAVAVKMLSPLGVFGPVNSAFMFLLSIPICWGGVWITIQLAALKPDQYIPAIAVGGAAATCCDGIALTWFRWLYGTDPEQVLYGAAWILWGVFLFNAAAIFEANRQHAAQKRLSN